jgi:hypothetical protein
MRNLLFEVIRHRQSVTQGEAEVLCNGQPIVRYGDHYVLNGKSTWSNDDKIYPMYGEIITGWGSRYNDEYFITGAIKQYTEQIINIIGGK